MLCRNSLLQIAKLLSWDVEKNLVNQIAFLKHRYFQILNVYLGKLINCMVGNFNRSFSVQYRFKKFELSGIFPTLCKSKNITDKFEYKVQLTDMPFSYNAKDLISLGFYATMSEPWLLIIYPIAEYFLVDLLTFVPIHVPSNRNNLILSAMEREKIKFRLDRFLKQDVKLQLIVNEPFGDFVFKRSITLTLPFRNISD